MFPAVPVVNQEVGHAERRLDRPIDTYSSIDIYIQHLQKKKKKKTACHLSCLSLLLLCDLMRLS